VELGESMRHEESQIQIAVANYLKYKYPQVLFTIAPSGVNLPIRVAQRMKAMGYAAGTPDLMIFEARGWYHGLFLELKTERGRASDLQKNFIAQLTKRQYAVALCFGYTQAIQEIDKYLNLEGVWCRKKGIANTVVVQSAG